MKLNWTKTKETLITRRKQYCKYCECLCTFEADSMCWGCKDVVEKLPRSIISIISNTRFKERTKRYWKAHVRNLLKLKHL